MPLPGSVRFNISTTPSSRELQIKLANGESLDHFKSSSPLLVATVHPRPCNLKFMTFYRPSKTSFLPKSPKLLVGKPHGLEKTTFAHVTRTFHVCYVVFVININGSKVALVWHKTVPIVDFCIGDTRYRILRKKHRPFQSLHKYHLLHLSKANVSLADGLNANLQVERTNPLLRSTLRNIMTPNILPQRLKHLCPANSKEIGSLRLWTSRGSSRIGENELGEFDLDSGVIDDIPESHVNFHTMLLACIVVVVKAYEDDLAGA